MSETDAIELLLTSGRGEPHAFERLIDLLYGDLKRVAHGQLMRLRPGQTLDTTGLVHEAYLKLVDGSRVDWRGRGHFLGVAARAMRQILIDHARQTTRQKRGGGRRPVRLDEEETAVVQDAENLLAIDEALERLGESEPRLQRVVECRYFVGYTEEETAAALGVSTRTVERDWLRAKALLRELISS
jgi:RNA polymerase sigma factor (TIGR02999 family)